MDVRHDVVPVDDERHVARRAQRHVQHGSILGDVDPIAAEHGVDAPAEIGLVGQSARAARSCRRSLASSSNPE